MVKQLSPRGATYRLRVLRMLWVGRRGAVAMRRALLVIILG